jgi:hypothetical protein
MSDHTFSLPQLPQTVGIGELADAVRRNPQTVRLWLRQHPGLGIRIGDRWSVRADAARMICEGVHPRDAAASIR